MVEPTADVFEIPLSGVEIELILSAADVAVKKSQDSMAAAAQFWPLRTKLLKAMKEKQAKGDG